MAITGVLHITAVVNSPSSSQTPATIILSHLSDLYPTQVHHPFHLDHRLFVLTSSLLPQIDSKRTYTHLLSSSHSPQKTFVGTTASPSASSTVPVDTNTNTNKSNNNLSTITIPTSASLEPLTTLLNTKLQPQWAARQFLVLDNGASVLLPITDDAKWKISVGDLRLAPGRVSGAAAGQLRGVLLELQYEGKSDALDVDLDNEDSRKKHELLFRALLKGLFRNMKLDLKLDDAKMYLASTPVSKGADGSQADTRQQQLQDRPPGYEIAELYMEVLQGSRG